jgi:tripartite ATP-independent transporter DctP family solute receptor
VVSGSINCQKIIEKRGRKMTKIRKMIFLVLFIGLVALSISTNAPIYANNQQYVFKIPFSNAAELKIGDKTVYNAVYVQLKTFKESVEKATKGRMKVEIFLNGRLGDNKSCLEQMLSGTLESATISEGELPSFYKDIQILSTPYCFRDNEHFHSIVDGKFGKKLFNNMARKTDIRLLSIFAKSFRSFSNNKRLVKTADDMKGIKIRTMDSPVHQALVKALGATPVPVAWAELYTALQTGVVDGQENSAQTMLAGSLQEVQKYYTIDKHFIGTSMLVTSESYLKSLPKDIRNAVISAGRKADKAAQTASDQNESLAFEYIKKSCSVYIPTSAERNTFRQRSQASCVKLLKKNIDHPQLVDQLLKLANK